MDAQVVRRTKPAAPVPPAHEASPRVTARVTSRVASRHFASQHTALRVPTLASLSSILFGLRWSRALLSAGRYRRLKNVVVVMDVLPDRQHLQEASGWGTGQVIWDDGQREDVVLPAARLCQRRRS